MVKPCSTRVECVIKSMLIAVLTLSPMAYRLTRSILSKSLSDAKGCPSVSGFILHVVVFGAVSYLAYSFDLYASLRSLKSGVKKGLRGVDTKIEKAVKSVESEAKKIAAEISKPFMKRPAATKSFQSAQGTVGKDDDVNVTNYASEKQNMRGYKTAGLHTRSANKVNALGTVTRSSMRHNGNRNSMTSQETLRTAREQA